MEKPKIEPLGDHNLSVTFLIFLVFHFFFIFFLFFFANYSTLMFNDLFDSWVDILSFIHIFLDLIVFYYNHRIVFLIAIHFELP
jgi:hypothetical protein